MRLTPDKRETRLAEAKRLIDGEIYGRMTVIINNPYPALALDLADELAAAKRRIDAIRDIDLSDLDIGDASDYGDKELSILAGYWNIGAAKRELFAREEASDWPTGEGMAEIDERENKR